jgi:hypothetical protein
MAAADSLPDHIPVLVFCVVRFSEEEGSGVVFTKKNSHQREGYGGFKKWQTQEQNSGGATPQAKLIKQDRKIKIIQ